MNKKQGISLIVLVITIIVMIILAAAIIISLNNSGVINRANEAVNASNLSQVRQLASMIWAEAYLDNEPNLDAEYIKEKLEENDVDTSKYNITVTDSGVSVTSKTETVTGWRIEREYDESGLITKAVVTDGTVSYEIGTTVNYMPEGVGPEGAKYTGTWKLLGVDDEGRLLIMSTDSITGSTVQLSGQDGFINGLTTLQNTVNSYKDGLVGVAVRSVTVEDIDAVTGYDPDSFTGEEYLKLMVDVIKMQGAEGTDSELEAALLTQFGLTEKSQMSLRDNGLQITYSWDGTEYPKYSYVVNGVTKTGNFKDSHRYHGFTYYDSATNSFKTVAYTTTPGTIATVKNDMHMYFGPLKYAETSKAYKMLFMTADETDTSTYWLASRYVGANHDCVHFGMRDVGAGILGGYDFVYSDGFTDDYSCAVRAVVTLASGITLKDSTTTTGTYDIVQ